MAQPPDALVARLRGSPSARTGLKRPSPLSLALRARLRDDGRFVDQPRRCEQGDSQVPTGVDRRYRAITDNTPANDFQRRKIISSPPLRTTPSLSRISPDPAVAGRVPGPAVRVALCRRCHRTYDRGELDLLPYLEPAWRPQLAHAVGHVGLVGALRRISGNASPY